MTTIEVPQDVVGSLSAIEEQFEDMLTKVRAELDQLDAHRADLMATVAKIDEEKRRFEKILKAIAPSDTKIPRRSPSPRARNSGLTISLQVAYRVRDAITALDLKEFTISDLQKQMNLASHSGVRKWVSALRDIEYLGKAGKAPGSATVLYRVLDPDALKKFEEIEESHDA